MLDLNKAKCNPLNSTNPQSLLIFKTQTWNLNLTKLTKQKQCFQRPCQRGRPSAGVFSDRQCDRGYTCTVWD